MSGIRVLLVDDSRFILTSMRALFAESGDIAVAETLTSGAAALAYLSENRVDAVVLDLHMPEMDGAETARRIMAAYPTPILMLTSAEKNDPGVIEALEAGALDMVQKPGRNPRSPFLREARDEIFHKVRMVAQAKIKPRAAPATAAEKKVVCVLPRKFELVVIGISTGGPGVLGKILPELTTALSVPVLIVQHIADGYTADLAHSLQQKCCVPVREAVNMQPLQKGTVTFAASGRHLEVSPAQNLRLPDSEPVNGFKPSVDVLFLSAAKNFVQPVLGIIMTGMGNDGLVGCKALKQQGHYVIIQDRESSVVWGMPGEVHKAGCYDKMLSLAAIADIFRQL